MSRGIRACLVATLALGAACRGDDEIDASDLPQTMGAAPALPPEADSGRELHVPSDPRARYFVLGVEGPAILPIITTLRVGASGPSYSRRRYNCSDHAVMYLGTGSTIAEAELERPDPGMAPIVAGAIADHVGRVACNPDHPSHVRR